MNSEERTELEKKKEDERNNDAQEGGENMERRNGDAGTGGSSSRLCLA